MARAPTSSPRRTPVGLPLDDGRGHAKRTAIGNANVPEQILSPWVIVTRRHAGHSMEMTRQAMNTPGRDERPRVKHGLHIYRALPTGFTRCAPATWNLTCLPPIRTRVRSTWTRCRPAGMTKDRRGRWAHSGPPRTWDREVSGTAGAQVAVTGLASPAVGTIGDAGLSPVTEAKSRATPKTGENDEPEALQQRGGGVHPGTCQ